MIGTSQSMATKHPQAPLISGRLGPPRLPAGRAFYHNAPTKLHRRTMDLLPRPHCWCSWLVVMQ